MAERSTRLTPTGLEPNPGTVNDTLTLSAALVGASGGIRLGERLPLTFRLGVGALFGSVRDRRTGSFTTVERDVGGQHLEAAAYSVNVAQSRPAVSLYVAPEARIGYPIAKRLELSVGIEGLVAIALVQPKWAPQESKINAATDGQATFAADPLTDRVFFGLQLGLGARYEF